MSELQFDTRMLLRGVMSTRWWNLAAEPGEARSSASAWTVGVSATARVERDGERGQGMGEWKRQKMGVSEHEGHEPAAARDAEEAAAAAEHAEQEEAARLGD